MQDRILMELSKRLAADSQGSCPHDKSCPFGIGVSECSADIETASAKFETAKEAFTASNIGICTWTGPEARPWPCVTITIVQFVEPQE